MSAASAPRLEQLVAEAQRVLAICNACRYCEGYCAVFPAMAARREFEKADLTHLANPAGNWLESNTTNNLAWVKLRLTRQGANPKVAVVDRSPCPVTSPTDPAYQVICGNTSNK